MNLYSEKSLSTDIFLTDPDKLADSGYKSTNAGFSIGTGFEQYDDLYFRPTFSTIYEQLTTNSSASANLKKQEGETELAMKCPAEWRKYILLKGYVAVNGASLTVAKVSQDSFSVFLIPETLASTNLSLIEDKDQVNIEIDQATMAAFTATET